MAALGASTTQSIEYSGTGRWFQFGQAPAPNLPWPPFDVSRYVASLDYAKASARVQIVRKQVVEAGRHRPTHPPARPPCPRFSPPRWKNAALKSGCHPKAS